MTIRKINYTVIAPEIEQEIKDKYTKQETDTMLSNKVDNSRVLTDVPINAKFTDTMYSNLTDNELQLGNYKLVYNSTTNSLDIEVVV